MSIKEGAPHGESPQQVELQAIKFNGFGRDKEDPEHQFHTLTAGDREFGFTYGSRDGLAVIWHGQVDFNQLDAEVSKIHEYVTGKSLNFKDKKTRESVGVVLMPDDQRDSVITRGIDIPGSEIRTETGITNEVRLPRLSEPGIYREYREILKRPERVSFMRMEVYGNTPEAAEEFTITAENPEYPRETPESEITVKLPKGAVWSEGLLEWVVEHHVDSDKLQENLDIKAAARTINRLSENLPQ